MSLVSIIVPVYNAEQYLDRCIDSLVEQTLSDVEIILVNDGSTDSAGEICKKWAAQYDNIFYAEQENQGPGPARNLGISLAKSDYLMFVDADDRVDYTMAEKLYKKAIEQRADVVVCGIVFTGETVGPKNPNLNIDTHASLLERGDLIYKISASMCDKLVRKDLLTNNNLFFPAGRYEDMMLSKQVVYFATRISTVEECLYFYFYNHQGNYISTIDEHHQKEILTALRYITDLYKSVGIFNDYREQIMLLLKMEYAGWIGSCRRNGGNVRNAALEYAKFYEKIFDVKTVEHIRAGIAGSYNLRAILQSLFFDRGNIVFHYKPDNTRKFISELPEICDKADFLLIDLLEEDLFVSEYNNDEWKSLYDSFIAQVKRYYPQDRVILVELYLCEDYGFDCHKKKLKRPYLDEICGINKILAERYRYIRSQLKDVKTVRLEDSEYIFADINHIYGLYPYHMNAMAYLKYAMKISEIIPQTL